MKIIIEAEPKEIAALVLAVQERHGIAVSTIGDMQNDRDVVEQHMRKFTQSFA